MCVCVYEHRCTNRSWTANSLLLILLGIYQDVELPDHTIICLIFSEIAVLFCVVAASLNIPTNHAQGDCLVLMLRLF